MIELHNKGFTIINQVHDSIVVEISKNDLTKQKEFVSIMEGVVQLRVPLKAEIKLLTSLSEKELYNG